jgi:hypothetical protein
MFLRVMRFLVGVSVLACVVPAIAGASGLTQSPGVVLPVGSSLNLTGTNITIQSSLLGNITCGSLVPVVKVTKNAGGTFEAAEEEILGAPAQSGCKNGTQTVKVTTFDISSLESSISTSGTMSFTSIQDIGSLVCKFTGRTVPFSYSAGTGSSTITFTAAGGITGSGGCGTGKLSGSFVLERTSTGTKVLLD